ncbi:hypothetical protein [Wenxinia saemankumensis]|uniref:4-hydroxy-4-methyl-2-oxoglutarate aldolase n=1 Tax=Wenxinia saemankumensis TaxID=1447782 RepID=A0A1M6B473_9RHOB|nr:hypothetical protein [Wenxinia saemankumensis]SHI43480.1 regulator of ribonuclease activity A [Wenxinia saemankumensis]
MTLAPQDPIVTADLYDDHHKRVEVIDLQFRSFGGVETFFGPAAVLETHHDHEPVLAALSEPGKARVLVVAAQGSLTVGVMGDRLAARAVENGWRGVIVDGAIRDSLGMEPLPLGVRARGTTARRGWAPGPSRRGGPVTIGGVQIRDGDWIYADRDAVMRSHEPL